jgi:hypothetical protein
MASSLIPLHDVAPYRDIDVRIESTGFTPVQVSARRGDASPHEDLCTTMRHHRALSTFALPDALSPSRRWHAKLMRSDSFSMMT